jgi:3-methyladenine DNA glycosylase AlkD
MTSVNIILNELKKNARPEQLNGMTRYGIVVEKRLGVSIPNLRNIAKELGKDHKLALNLWKTSIPDAQILAGMIDEPEKLTEKQMEDWVNDINSWDVCDQTCANLFEKTPLAWEKIHEWSKREEEFVKRTAFALIACLAWHDKKAGDRKFIKLLTIIEFGANDERNFVKKAVNWALRNIGKRNRKLNKAAVNTAKKIGCIKSKSARWIASDAIRELTSDSVKKRLEK